jgi:hypothetical protein
MLADALPLHASEVEDKFGVINIFCAGSEYESVQENLPSRKKINSG